jgi:aspartyl-tRNA(Asn)/glutamyl-tRNA(Gln) amidotransferase subunit C
VQESEGVEESAGYVKKCVPALASPPAPDYKNRMQTNPEDLDVDYVANLARIHLTEDERAAFGRQLNDILTYVQELNTLDVEGVEPTAHAVPVTNVFRDDVVRPGIRPEQALANAPASRSGQFLVPRILE